MVPAQVHQGGGDQEQAPDDPPQRDDQQQHQQQQHEEEEEEDRSSRLLLLSDFEQEWRAMLHKGVAEVKHGITAGCAEVKQVLAEVTHDITGMKQGITAGCAEVKQEIAAAGGRAEVKIAASCANLNQKIAAWRVEMRLWFVLCLLAAVLFDVWALELLKVQLHSKVVP